MPAYIHIVGRLGADPEGKQVGDNTVVSLRVASDHRVKRDGELVKQTTWYRCELWGRQGEVAQRFLTKGREVVVHGTLEPRAYTDREGVERQSLDVRVTHFDIVGGRGDAGEGASQERGGGYQQRQPQQRSGGGAPQRRPQAVELDDEIPFRLAVEDAIKRSLSEREGLRASVV